MNVGGSRTECALLSLVLVGGGGSLNNKDSNTGKLNAESMYSLAPNPRTALHASNNLSSLSGVQNLSSVPWAIDLLKPAVRNEENEIWLMCLAGYGVPVTGQKGSNHKLLSFSSGDCSRLIIHM